MTKHFLKNAFATARWKDMSPSQQSQLGSTFGEKCRFDSEASEQMKELDDEGYSYRNESLYFRKQMGIEEESKEESQDQNMLL